MSYSISVVKSSTREVIAAVRDELVNVRNSQPIHTRDIERAFDAARSLLELVESDPNLNIRCNISGTIYVKDDSVKQVSISISVDYQQKT